VSEKMANDEMGAEDAFFDDPMQDRLLAVCMTLATELWVTKSRLEIVENKLCEAGILDAAAMGDEPSDADRLRQGEALNAFVEGVMRAVQGQQASRPAADDILRQFK